MTRIRKITFAQVGRKYGRVLADDRLMTRKGLRAILVAIHRGNYRREPLWWQLWAANRWAYHEALYTWHVKIPPHYANHDRIRVAWELRGGAETSDQHKALAWSQNSR